MFGTPATAASGNTRIGGNWIFDNLFQATLEANVLMD
jgi:hypothetical protein